MKKVLKIGFLVGSFLGAFFLVGSIDLQTTAVDSGNYMSASVPLTQVTPDKKSSPKFEAISESKEKIKVLIVPGHEPRFGGAEFFDIKERDLNVALAQSLERDLVADGHYVVTMTRGSDGWNPIFDSYFLEHEYEINNFINSKKMEMAKLMKEGNVTALKEKVIHNKAPSDVAFRLFAINKWANDQKTDVVIHVHFNDDASRGKREAGEYNGFVVYTPDKQYSNGEISNLIASNILKRITRVFPVSSLPQENQGIVQDQKLIAVGANNTVDAASMLVEYGYIYEPQFQNSEVKALVLKEMAFQTYLGIADFFGKNSLLAGPYESTLLPYDYRTVVKKTKKANAGVLAFQVALVNQGFYPPQNYTKNECPVSGILGPCTRTALAQFQNEFGIKKESGIVGEETRAQLAKLFEQRLITIK